MSLTVLIADDDTAMRQILKRIVNNVPGLKVIGEAEDGVKAIEMYKQFNPSVVFIDIDMPNKNGLELAREIYDINPWTKLVFCTGLPEYKGEAYEIFAFNYVDKPIREDKLHGILNRIVEEEVKIKKDAKKSEKLKKKYKDLKRFIIDSNIVNVADIIYIGREGNKTLVFLAKSTFETNESLNSLEERLNSYGFVRTHRGFLVNVRHIVDISPYSKTAYEITMYGIDKRPLLHWEKLTEIYALK